MSESSNPDLQEHGKPSGRFLGECRVGVKGDFLISAPHLVPLLALQTKYNVGCPGREKQLKARKQFHGGSYAASRLLPGQARFGFLGGDRYELDQARGCKST